MVVHAFNPSIGRQRQGQRGRERERGRERGAERGRGRGRGRAISDFKASLVYMVSSKTAKAYTEKPYLEKPNQN